MFWKWFRSKEDRKPARDVGALTRGLTLPAIHVVKAEVASRSYLGGVPELPPGVPWPEAGGKPLSFLAQIELAELQSVVGFDWLPQTGALLFFYDLESQPWGFDPRDRGKWAVLHLPAAVEAASALPGKTKHSSPGRILRRAGVTFRSMDSYPPFERETIAALKLSDEEAEALTDLQTRPFQGRPQHQVGGFPSPVQGDIMELECQLVSHGIYCGDESGYRDPRATELGASARDWKLLLEFDSDDDLDVMWGDAGMLYFWVREQDARAGNFADTWLVLQCY